MVIEAAILNHLRTNVDIVNRRVYLDELPQNATLPAITISLVSGQDEGTFGDDSNTADESFQVSIWAKTREDTIRVAKQVRSSFKAFSGVIGGAGGVEVSGINHEGTFDREDIVSGITIFSRNMTYGFIYEKE